MRELVVIVSAVVGAAFGYYVIGGGQGTPAEIIENPDLLTENTNAMLWLIGGALRSRGSSTGSSSMPRPRMSQTTDDEEAREREES